MERHPIGLGLDDKPPGAILPEHLGRQTHVSSACDRRAPREAQRGQDILVYGALATNSQSRPIQIQASARGTDAERASRVQWAGGVITALSCDEQEPRKPGTEPICAAYFFGRNSCGVSHATRSEVP